MSIFLQPQLDEFNGKISELKKMVYQLITPDGKPRPGTTNDQLRAAIQMLEQLNGKVEKGVKEIEATYPECEKVAENVRFMRKTLSNREKESGVPLPPMLKSMLNM